MEALCPHSVHLCSSHVSYVALWFTEGRCYSDFRKKEIDTEPKWMACLQLCRAKQQLSLGQQVLHCLSLMLCCAHPNADTVAMTVKTATLLD